MNLTTERHEDVLSVGVNGRIGVSNAVTFEEAVRNAFEDTDRAVIVDLCKLTYIGGSGLRAVLMAAKFANARGAGMALCGPSEQVLEVISISGFDRIVPVRDTPAEARAALGV